VSAAAVANPESLWVPRVNPWLIAFVVSLAAFMEVLDTSIANVALPHIAGNLGASSDESTWVLTSYLVSNAIVLPITGWLVSLVGRKRFFIICISLFTVSSLLCGIAPTLGLLLLARVVQGIGGGGLQPMAQAILADTFPPKKRGLAFSVYGVTAVVAPAIGPTLGGWVTDSYSWRWIFLMNLPVGIMAILLVLRYVDDPPFLRRTTIHESKIDYFGFGLLAVGVGFLQIVLDKGQEDDWFGSHFITTLSIISIVCLVTLVIWELRVKTPILDLRLFKNVNFATASLILDNGAGAAVSAEPDGLHGRERRHGAVRRGGAAADRAADRRAVNGAHPSAVSHRLWLGYADDCNVLLHAAARSGDELFLRDVVAHRAISAHGIHLHPGDDGGVHRLAAGEEQCDRGPDQFRAQHRRERGNLGGDDDPGATRAGAPGDAG
jgi:MFS family permease